ncbi:MAG: glycosyltransferase family 4 protein [Chloroflexota bacterium]
MKIAYFSPLPPERTGIAAYSAMLLPALARLADLTVFTHEPEKAPESLAAQFLIRPISEFAGTLAAGADMCLYQMGNNSQFHYDIYQMMRRYPGVVTLHDVNLHSFYGDLYVVPGRTAAYCREMAFDYGAEGVAYARGSVRGLHPYGAQEFPLFGRVVRSSLGVVVHSQFAAAQIRERYPQTALRVVPIVQEAPRPDLQMTADAAKKRLGYAPETVLLASFGYISANKRLDVILRAFARLNGRFPQLRLVLVGQVVEGYNLQSLCDELNLNNDLVRLVGYADDDTFAAYLAAADVGLNLRYPTLGESSATLLRLLALGKPVLVSAVDAFVELPEMAVVHIPIGADEQDQVESHLAALIADPSARQALGSRAAELVREQHMPEIAAERYVEFAREVLSGG